MSKNRNTQSPWLEAQHIQDWMRATDAKIVGLETVGAFADYLELQLPWSGPHLDWSQLHGSRLNLAGSPDAEAWARSMRIGQHEFVLAVRSRAQPGVAASLEAVMSSIDTLAWQVPGALYFCGSDSLDPLTLAFEDLVEYDGIEHLIGR